MDFLGWLIIWGGMALFSYTLDFGEEDSYARKEWQYWLDKDGDCQNERAEILLQFSRNSVSFSDKKACVVATGLWFGQYSGKVFRSAREIDIDHMVPLKEAYESGGKHWDQEMKRRFANDGVNLIPVSRVLNRAKGARDPAGWMPPNEDYHCEYIYRWLAIKSKYGLAFDAKEQEYIYGLLDQCALRTLQ